LCHQLSYNLECSSSFIAQVCVGPQADNPNRGAGKPAWGSRDEASAMT